MTNTVFTRSYDSPDIDIGEILRYAGVRGEAPELDDLLRGCLDEARGKLIYKVCYREFPVAQLDGKLDLGFCETESAALMKNLAGCSRILLFAATIGIGIDRLIARYGTVSPAKALMLQAIGAERIESLCDAFNREIAAEYAQAGFATRPRFSPGYGDMPISVQKEIFSVLDCPRKIGLSLNDSMLMSPSKSVTALIGITSGDNCYMREHKCGDCDKQDCGFRRKI